MDVRRRTALLLAIIGSSACHNGPPTSAAGARLLLPASEAEAAHDELVRADIGRADSVAKRGWAIGLGSAFADDILYLRGGLPILKGRFAAIAVVAAESLDAKTVVRWQPVRAEISRDRKSGYTYGYAIYGSGTASGPALRVDRYIAYWRREADAWRIAGYAETYGSAPASVELPADALAGVVADVAMSRTRAAIDVIRAADEDFSRDAARNGPGDAFAHYAAEGAQVFSTPGEFITGPVAIMQSFGPRSEHSSLIWHPVDGDIAGSEDIGFTVGNAVLTGEREDGAPLITYSKYLTVWQRQPDGKWKYIVDGGSARPGR